MSMSCPYHSIKYYTGLWIGSWILAFFCTSLPKTRFIHYAAWILWFVNIILILYIALFTKGVKGARRWIFLFNQFSYQPSEMMKLCLALVLCQLLISNQLFIAHLLYLISAVSLLLQPDLGNTIIISIVYIIIMIVTRISVRKVLYSAIIMGMVALTVGLNLDYTKKRLKTFNYKLNNKITLDHSYQNFRAIQAIQNGGLFGVGAGMGTVKKLLPDAYSDFIFAVIIEELGLFGGILLSISFLVFQLYCIYCANRLKFCLESISIISISSIITIQAWIHMSSCIWLIPTKGTTLPLISHGGVSTLISHITIGLILKLISSGKKTKAIT